MTKMLPGKVALITGGSHSIGAATVLLLAENGADITISYISSDTRAKAILNINGYVRQL